MPVFTRIVILATLLASQGARAGASNCCAQLRAQTSSEKVLEPPSVSYSTENLAYWSSTCILAPQCIFTPTSALDVSIAVKTFAKLGCQFATRGGGHTPNPGWAGTSSGILVSLSKLNAIQISEDTKSVLVGAGNEWGAVYSELDRYNITVAGGRVPPVGVSGYLLGGGLSFLMHQFGFAADSVLGYEIVLADGKIADVSAANRSDLFKALKGGSGNFGIVTAFRLQTYPIHNIYAGNLYYDPTQYDALFPLIETYARQGVELDAKSHIIFSFANAPSQSLRLAVFYAFYADAVNVPPPVLQPFMQLPTVLNTVSPKTVKQAVEELGTGGVNGLRYTFHTYSIRADAALFKQLLQLWESTTSGLDSLMAFQPVSNNMIQASSRRGGNVLGIKHPLVIVHYLCLWLSESDDSKVYATFEQLVKTSKAIAQSQGKLSDFIYLNYASTGQPVIKSYGPAQVNFLRNVRKKYDPNGVFRKLSPGGFKIPN